MTSDKANVFTFEVKTCALCGGADKFGRMQRHSDEVYRKQRGENRDPAEPDPADGRRVYARLMSESEVQQARTKRKVPDPPS